MLTHPGILTATLWKIASSPFPAYTDVIIELLSLTLFIAGIIKSTLEWAVQAGHRLSIRLRTTGPRSVEDRRTYIRPLGGRTGAVPFLHFNGHQPQNWKRSPGMPLPSAVSCRLTWQSSRREFAGLSVWQPHTKVNTNEGETGFESWWTLLWCLWRPPSLPE